MHHWLKRELAEAISGANGNQMTTDKRAVEFTDAFERNVFVMMRYRSDDYFQRIESSIKVALLEFDLQARLAKDVAFHEDLWSNIVFYMKNSKYGVAVFEEIDEREYNPNISMELGFMFAQERRCLLLKDKRMPRLPTDTCGRIYRDFDAFEIEKTITHQVGLWCEKDLGLARTEAPGPTRLDRYIEKNVDTSKFIARAPWEDYILSVIRHFDGEETLHIVWNERKKRLSKFYKYGVRWEGPLALTRRERISVCDLLSIDRSYAKLAENGE